MLVLFGHTQKTPCGSVVVAIELCVFEKFIARNHRFFQGRIGAKQQPHRRSQAKRRRCALQNLAAMREHVFEQLRKGLVPERGIETFAVGIEKQRAELHRQLDLAGVGEGSIKFLRGGYGCGKTFMARLALLDAQARDFATSFVVVSDNDLRFHRFDDVYRKVMTELGTISCPRGALGDILDRWIGKVEEGLIAAGEDETGADFDDKVRRRLDTDLAAMTSGQAPQDFIRVVQAIFGLKQQGNCDTHFGYNSTQNGYYA